MQVNAYTLPFSQIQFIKNGFTGPVSYWVFQETGPDQGEVHYSDGAGFAPSHDYFMRFKRGQLNEGNDSWS